MPDRASSFGATAARVFLLCALIPLAWLLMQVVHELGHVIHAWLSGGQVNKVVLYPTVFSRTDVSPNPHPNFVTWGGPLWGIILPLGATTLLKLRASRYQFLADFFSGFCLIANGAYLAAGALWRIGDADDLLRHGTPAALPVACGLVAVAAGIYFWNGLGPHFGVGADAKSVPWSTAIAVAAALAVLLVIELAVASR